jgi:galactokinase
MHVSAFAPGRVNLIGDHTDHTGGLVLPMAVGMGTTVTGVRRGDTVVLRSDADPDPIEVALDLGDPAVIEPSWGRYVAGVVSELRPGVGFVGTVSSTLPSGSGLSSSAALTVSVALALGAPAGDPVAVAELCQRAEQRALGVPCGIMDQLVSLVGREGHALLIDTARLTWRHVPVPREVEVRVIDSGQPRALASSGYRAVRDRCVRAHELLGDLGGADPDAWRGIERSEVRTAARHVIGENARVRAFAAALESGELSAAGRLMGESHRSLVALGVSTPVLDALVERLGATPGVHGARLTGAGFGGWVVALAEPGALAEGMVVTPCAGAHVNVR